MTIPIYENEGYDAKTNTTYHIAGYTKMEKEEKYLLLLQKIQKMTIISRQRLFSEKLISILIKEMNYFLKTAIQK